jgi:hypothetical protein
VFRSGKVRKSSIRASLLACALLPILLISVAHTPHTEPQTAELCVVCFSADQLSGAGLVPVEFDFRLTDFVRVVLLAGPVLVLSRRTTPRLSRGPPSIFPL